MRWYASWPAVTTTAPTAGGCGWPAIPVPLGRTYREDGFEALAPRSRSCELRTPPLLAVAEDPPERKGVRP